MIGFIRSFEGHYSATPYFTNTATPNFTRCTNMSIKSVEYAWPWKTFATRANLGANRWERLTILRIKSTAKMQEYILITDVSLNTYSIFRAYSNRCYKLWRCYKCLAKRQLLKCIPAFWLCFLFLEEQTCFLQCSSLFLRVSVFSPLNRRVFSSINKV